MYLIPFESFLCFWPGQLWQWVPQPSCMQTKETYFLTSFSFFLLSFLMLPTFVLWEALRKHPLFSPHHSWFFMHWTCSPSAVVIPVCSGLFHLIFLPKWSLVIHRRLPFSVLILVLLYPEIQELVKKSEYMGKGSMKIWTIKALLLLSDSTEKASRGKKITSNCGVNLNITRVPSQPKN